MLLPSQLVRFNTNVIESSQSKVQLDSKIKSNPLEAYNVYKDGREERFVIGAGSSDKWVTKQAGLNWSDNK